MDYNILSVYDSFDVLDGTQVDEFKLLFGRVISEGLSKRGIDKIVKFNSIKRDINKDDLPHLKYSNNNEIGGNWFYVKEGDYFIFSAIKSDFEKVCHLEGIGIYGDIILRLRVVIELLKRNISRGIISLSEQDFNNIGFKVLRSEPSTRKISDEDIQNGLNNWLPSMLLIPLFEEIPVAYREKVKD